MEKNYLAHWGVKGMKWGVRRYQRKDGSLTPVGKKRYGDSNTAKVKRVYEVGEPDASGKRNVRMDVKLTKKQHRELVKNMSDHELRTTINRLQMEKQYADLTRKKGNGKKIINAFISTAGTITAVTGAYATYKTLANKGIDKIGDWVVSSIDLTKPFA